MKNNTLNEVRDVYISDSFNSKVRDDIKKSFIVKYTLNNMRILSDTFYCSESEVIQDDGYSPITIVYTESKYDIGIRQLEENGKTIVRIDSCDELMIDRYVLGYYDNELVICGRFMTSVEDVYNAQDLHYRKDDFDFDLDITKVTWKVGI